MDSLLYKIKARVLTMFGDVSVYPWPMFAIYNPGAYKMTGPKVRRVLDCVQAGDVVLRGYNNYLDSFFIPLGESRCSHSGIYVGGNQVIHSVAEGVISEDILTFCRADRVIVLRPRLGVLEKMKAIDKANSLLGRKYDFNFDTADTEDSNKRNDRYFCHEFTKTCYSMIQVERKVGRARFLGLKSPPVYLADSFYLNHQFDRVYNSGSRSSATLG